MTKVLEITKLIGEIETIVKRYYRMEFENESVYYYRFVTHLKFLAQRLVTKTTYDEEESELFTMVRDKYDQSYQCVERNCKVYTGRISLWSFRGRKVIFDNSH